MTRRLFAIAMTAVGFLSAQSTAWGWVHFCSFGTVSGGALNPTVYTEWELTAFESTWWDTLFLWQHSTTGWSDNTSYALDPEQYPNNVIAFTYIPLANYHITIESDFTLRKMLYNAFGSYWVYEPPYEPDTCMADGYPQLP